MIRSNVIFPLRTQTRFAHNVSWATGALALGLLIATQPLSISLMVIGLGVTVFLSFFSPLIALVAMLIIAPLRSVVAAESSVHLPLDPGQLMVLVAVGSWVLFRVVTKQRLLSLHWSPVYILLALFIGATGLTITTAYSISAWMTEWLKWVIIAGLIVLVLASDIPRVWQWLAFGIIVAGVVNALVGVYIFLGGSGASHLLINDRFFRAFGTFGQPNPFGGFMGITAPIAAMMALGYLQVIYSRFIRFRQIDIGQVTWFGFYGVAAAILAIGVFISWSRGAWLGFGISSAMIMVLTPRRQVIGLAVAVGLITGGLFAWSSDLLPGTITNRINSATTDAFTLTDVRAVDITTTNYPIVERLAHWQAAYDMAEHNFWLGVGFGNYEIAYAEYQLVNWDEPLGHAHNYYLNIFAETGFIGLTAYLLLIVGILWLVLQARQHPDPIAHAVCVGVFGSWTYILIHSLTDNLYVNNMFLHIGIILSIAALLHNEVRAVKVAAI